MDAVCALCEKIVASCCGGKKGGQSVRVFVDNRVVERHLCQKCSRKMLYQDRLENLKKNIIHDEASWMEHLPLEDSFFSELPLSPPKFYRQRAQRGREMPDDDPEGLG